MSRRSNPTSGYALTTQLLDLVQAWELEAMRLNQTDDRARALIDCAAGVRHVCGQRLWTTKGADDG